MKSFLDHLKEEVLPTVQVADGGLDISKPAVRAAINAAIAGVVSQPAVTPYVVFNRLSKLLAQYHIVLPKRFLEGDKGVEVFELRQFGHKMGMTDSGEFVNEVPSTHYLFLQYGILSPFGITYAKPVVGGMFKVMARVVDKAELDKLMDMAEITMAEEAEQMQAIAKANAPKEGMHTALGDCDCSQGDSPSTKKAIKVSMKKIDEEYEKVEAGVKKRRGETHTLHRRNPGHKTEYHTITTERDGRKSVKTGSPKYIKKHWDRMEEDKDPCWKGYEMIGMKKKGGRKVPNCVPVEEATDKDRDLSKLASAAMSKGQAVKKLPAGRAENSVLPKRSMPKGANIEKGRWSGHGKFNEEAQIDEISTKLARSFVSKAKDGSRTQGVLRARGKMTGEPYPLVDKKHGNVTVGHASPKVLTKEEQIDELKKSTLASYIKKAHVSGLEAASQGEIAYANKDKAGLRAANKTGEKREQGIERAAGKLAREEKGDKITSGTGIPNFTQKNLQDVAKDLGTGQGGATFAMKSNSGTPSRQVNVSSDPAERGNKFTNRAPLDEKAPPGAKFERMVKHIKKGYAKDGLTAKEKGIAFATAWKAKNREKGE